MPLRLFDPDESMDVDFRMIGESFPLGVLVAEPYEPEGPWSPDPRVDRYLAPIRQAKLNEKRREQLRRLIEAQRRLYPPWWSRLCAAMPNCWTRSKPS